MEVRARPLATRPGGAFLFLALVVGLSGTSASAQERGFRLHRYDGTAAGSMTFLVERPWSDDEERSGAFGLTLDGSDQPLVPGVATGRGPVTPIVSQALVGHVDLAFSAFGRLLFNGSVPLTLLERGTPELLSGVGPVQSVQVGDPHFGLQLRLFGRPDLDAFSAHVGVDAWVPIGAEATHQGDTGFRVMPHLLLAGALGPVRWGLDGAYLLRQYASYGPPSLGMTAAPEGRAGASLQLAFLNDRLTIGPEAQFSMQLAGVNANTVNGMSLEVLGGLHVVLGDRLLLAVAGGTGFFGAAGTPDARAIVRLAWAPRPPVAETPEGVIKQGPPPLAPGVDGGAPAPPGRPRIVGPPLPVGTGETGTRTPSTSGPTSPDVAATGPADAGAQSSANTGAPPVTPPPPDVASTSGRGAPGAPEPTASTGSTGATTSTSAPGTSGDTDGDGIPDLVDRCPFEPETKNGFRDEDGCPELELEKDSPLSRVLTRPPGPPAPTSSPGATGPGPEAPGRTPAPVAEGGAPLAVAATPIVDSDGDGVPDSIDRCPATPEDADGFEDEDGCPEPDNDGDGVLDAKDECPEVAETVNGVDDDDGCPDRAKDSDRDGVPDALDRCPFEPEDVNGVRDEDGCPEAPIPHEAALAALLTPPPPAATPVASGAAPVDAAKPVVVIDSDDDAIPDAADRCPLTPEDHDGFEDEDGCPEPDNDDDGVSDPKDRCPGEAETVNGSKDDDGCPDEPADTDGDGVDYERDRCPLEPGDASDGCPHAPLPALALPGFSGATPDAAPAPAVIAAPVAPQPAAASPSTADLDGDGVTDEADACPVSPEDQDGFEDEDGCPEPDNDHDGVPDAQDKCPLEAETINGVKDTDGCPDVGKTVVSIKGNAVVIDGIVSFKTGSANLERKSLPLLQQVASTLKAWSTLSVEIQGHTDDAGNAATNIKLSKRRAEAIRAVLIKAGVDKSRLIATGYGPTRPRASNKTAKGRDMNRRVEFLLLGESK